MYIRFRVFRVFRIRFRVQGLSNQCLDTWVLGNSNSSTGFG